jgi:hypothetical protein
MKKFLSSGGLGDAWICFLKILHASKGERVIWDHMTGHQIHVDPVTELMTLMPGIQEAKCHKINRDTRNELEKSLMTSHTIRLNTKANEIENPIPNLSFVRKIYQEDDPYVIIQPGAGRPIDKSFRYFMPFAVDTLVEFFRDKQKNTVLLGAEYKARNDYALNLTNKTPIKTALELISCADFFVGFDGFLAYVAMSMNIPSCVIFHDPILPEHYMHNDWKNKTKFFVGPQRISEAKTLQEIIKC